MNLFKKLWQVIEDPIFLRVAICVFALPFTLLGYWGVWSLWQPSGWEWLGFALLAVVGTWGVFVMYISCFGSKERFERVSRFVDVDADILGLVFVLLVGAIAIPITILIRWILR